MPLLTRRSPGGLAGLHRAGFRQPHAPEERLERLCVHAPSASWRSTARSDSERFSPAPRTYRCFRGNLSMR